jgi:CheY-like chemotaxis protein
MLRRLIGEDIDLVWVPGTHLQPVRMDPSQLDQVLANLCVNARDAVTNGGTITIATANVSLDETFCSVHPGCAPGEYVRLSVSDNGCGMDQETLANIFDPFFTTKDIGTGTGLGLSTVYGIVKQNNGYIDVESESGAGSRFMIYLPRHTGRTDPASGMTGPEAPVARGTETVLLAEDEPANLEMYRRMLAALGYTVLAAATPDEAIRLAEDNAGGIALLLTDVVMPVMNGPDLAKAIRSSDPGIACLFMTGYMDSTIMPGGVLEPGMHLIQKPFSLEALAARIREVLGAPEER